MLKFVYFVYIYIGMASISIWWIHCGIITINDHIKWYIFYIIDCRVKLNLLFTHSLYNYNLLSMYTYLYCWIYIYIIQSQIIGAFIYLHISCLFNIFYMQIWFILYACVKSTLLFGYNGFHSVCTFIFIC